MKLRLLISILFIIATTATAIHELEHIHGDVDSSTCQVCIVDDHSVSADIIDDVQKLIIFRFENTNAINLVYSLHKKDYSYQNRAPPYIS